MAKRDKPVFSFIRRGNHLVPEMEYDTKALEGIAQGQRVRIDIKEWRNADRLKAYWSILHEVIDATGAAITAEKLHEVIKLECGLVDLIRLPTGMTVAIPASVAFDKMDEPAFIAFFQAAEAWLASTYGYVAEDRRAA